MQIDLYNQDRLSRMNTQMAKVTTRKYELQPQYADLAGVDKYIADPMQAEAYKQYLRGVYSRGRNYDKIGTGLSDSLYDLEVLNIGKYGHEYVMVADFSLCLDYILHRAFDCKIADIRGIKDYSRISKALLNNNFRSLESGYTFEILFDASPEFGFAMGKLSHQAKERSDLSIDDQVPWMVGQFYSTVLSSLQTLKFYTAMQACSDLELMNGTRGAIRSQSFSSVVASVHTRFSESITLHDLTGKFDDYNVVFRTYAPYEYLGEVIRQNELSW